MAARFIGVCGTPGVGKKTLAPVLASILGLDALPINEIALRIEGLQKSRLAPREDVEVDANRLRRWFSRRTRGAVVYGHLLPHVVAPADVRFVALLRCEPRVLKARLRARGYGDAKIRENVEAELIGVLLSECLGAFGPGKLREYDTSEDTRPTILARRIARDVQSGSHTPLRWIDWTFDYDSAAKLGSLLGPGRNADGAPRSRSSSSV